jgi:CheY-like chemotaxis protein
VTPQAIAQNTSLKLDLPPSPVETEADPARFQQVIVTLLGKALKDIPGGGSITVEARQHRDRVAVQIRATGGGFDPSQSDRIFELLPTRSAGETERLSVGMALAKKLIEEHHGTLSAFSAGHSTGATYEVSLPVVAAPDFTELETRAPNALRGLNLLLIEDHEDTREALAQLLETQQARVRTASNGQQGIDAALAQKPDVVLCDLAMPGLDGFAVARRLRQEPSFEKVPIFALTGHGMPLDRERAQAAGFSAHLLKPVDAGELVELIAATRHPA